MASSDRTEGDLNNVLGIMTVKMPYAAKQRVCLYTFAENWAYDVYQPVPCDEASVTTYNL